MSVFYPLIRRWCYFCRCAIAVRYYRVARARSHNRRGPGVLQEYRDIIKLLGRQSIAPADSGWVFRPDAVSDGRRDAGLSPPRAAGRHR